MLKSEVMSINRDMSILRSGFEDVERCGFEGDVGCHSVHIRPTTGEWNEKEHNTESTDGQRNRASP